MQLERESSGAALKKSGLCSPSLTVFVNVKQHCMNTLTELRIHSTTRRCVSACGQGQVVGILAPGSVLQPLLTCQLIIPMFVSMQCEDQSLESAGTTTHHLGKPLVLIYEV